MSRRLVVHDDLQNKLFSIDPQQATAVPIPAFRMGVATPQVGSLIGEAFLNSVTGLAAVWDGSQWQDIAKPTVLVQPTEAQLLAQTPPDDMPGIASDTGNFFMRTNGQWKQLGVTTYQTLAGMLTQHPIDGTLGVAIDVNLVAVYDTNAWRPLSSAVAEHIADVHAGNAPWDAPLDGMSVIGKDTGERLLYVNNQWVGDPVTHYPDDATLQAATPPDGVLAWADDTGNLYARANAQWTPIKTDLPPTTGANTDDVLKIADATAGTFKWEPALPGVPVGTIVAYPSVTPPAGWLLCDGSAIDAQAHPTLAALCGANTPNLVDQFIRGTATQNQIDGFTHHQDTTRRPRNNFSIHVVGDTQSDGNHRHHIYPDNRRTNWGSTNSYDDWMATWHKEGGSNTQYAGQHHHSIDLNGTVNGGGDPETAPAHVRMAYIIKGDG